MEIAKITYITLTVVTALAFAYFYLPLLQSDIGYIIIGTIWTGGSALCASWLSFNWLHPDTWGRYMLCGLLCALLFHIALAVCFALHGLFVVCININEIARKSLSENLLDLGIGITGTIGLFLLMLVKAGHYTLWLCLQTAVITKGLIWIVKKVNI